MSTSIDRLARLVYDLERRVNRGFSTPQLAHSSVENGSIDVNDIDGTTSMVIGKQDDGTHAPAVVAGPTPPQPSGVTLQPGLACLQAAWSGALVDALVAPGDFSRAEFHISTEGPDFVPDLVGDGSTTMFGTLDSPRGGEVAATGLPYVEHWVKVVIRTLSGKFGAASEAAVAIPLRVDGPDIEAGSITGDLLAGDIVLGSRISTGDIDLDESSPTYGQIIGQRLELSQSGLRVISADGQDIVNLSTDPDQPAIVRAHVETDSMRVTGGSSFESRNNEIAKDATMALSNGITPPVGGVVLNSGYDSIRFDTTTKYTTTGDGTTFGDLGNFAFNPSQAIAFNYDPDGYWYVSQKVSGGSRVWRFNLDGTIHDAGDFDDWTITGVVRKPYAFSPTYLGKIGGVWYLIGQPPGEGVAGYFAKVALVNSSTTPALNFDPVADAYIVAETQASTDRVRIRRLNVTVYTGGAIPNAIQQSVFNLPAGTGRSGSLSSILFGGFDFTGDRYLWAARGSYSTVWSSTALATMPDENFPLPQSGMFGVTWDGLNFWSLGPDGTAYKHESWTFTGSDTKLWAAPTFYDSDVAGGGTHETTLGTITGITRKKRALVLVTMPGVPDKGDVDDPDRWRLYTALNGSDTPPAASAFHLQATGVNATDPSLPSTVPLSGTNEVGAAPPTLNDFPGTNPAKLYSGATDADGALIDLEGDGTWRLGPMKSDDGVTITRKDEEMGRVLNETPSGGHITVPHSLGVVPTNIQVTPSAAWSDMGGMFSVAVYERTDVDFSVTFRDYANASVTSPVWFDWIARA